HPIAPPRPILPRGKSRTPSPTSRETHKERSTLPRRAPPVGPGSSSRPELRVTFTPERVPLLKPAPTPARSASPPSPGTPTPAPACVVLAALSAPDSRPPDAFPTTDMPSRASRSENHARNPGARPRVSPAPHGVHTPAARLGEFAPRSAI